MQAALLSILDAIATALIVIQENSVVTINLAATRLLGYSSADAAGLSWSKLVAPLNGTPIDLSDRPQIVNVIGRSGESTCVQMTLKPTEWDGQPALMATLIEQPADAAAKAAAAERYEILQKIVPFNAFCGVFHPDGSFTRDWMTESFTVMTGYTLDELGNSFSLYHPDDQARAREDLDAARHGIGGKHEYRIITKSGETRWVSVDRYPIWDEQAGRITHFYGVAQDITEYRQTTNALRESEERYRLISELISDYAYSYSVQPNGTLVHEWITDSFTRMTGYTHEEIDAKGTYALFAPEEEARVEEHMRDVLAGRSSSHEYQIITRSGERRWVNIVRYPVWNAHERRVVRLYGVAQDITERKRAEEALRQSEERYRIISELISDYAYCFRVNPDRTIENDWVLGSVDRITGYTRQERRAMDELALYAPEDRARAKLHLQQVIDGQADTHEYCLITKNGERRWVQIYRQPVWSPVEKRVTHFYGVTQDITERKRAEEALRRSEERYRIVSELIADYAYSVRVEPDGSLTPEWVTDSFRRITGYEPAEIKERGQFSLYAPEDRERIRAHHRAVLQGSTTDYDYQIITKSGERRWVNLVRYPEWNEDHTEVIRMYGVAQDITERKQAEEALRQSEERYRIVAGLISDYAFCYRVNPDRTITRELTTESFQRMTGFEPDEKDLLGQLALYPPDEQTRVRQHLEQVMDGQAGGHDYQIITKTGESRWLHVYRKPLWDEQEGRVVRFYGVAQDITERKLAEQVMRESEEKYRLMAENVTDMITKHSLDGRYTYVSPAALHLPGYEPDAMIGHLPPYFIPPEDLTVASRLRPRGRARLTTSQSPNQPEIGRRHGLT